MSETVSKEDAWWRLGAAGAVRRAEELGWDAAASHYDFEWLGREWDGQSNLDLGDATVTVGAIATVVDMLRSALVTHDVKVARLPDHRSVRQLPSSQYWPSPIVVDIDFGDFIQPFRVSVECHDPEKGSNATELIAATIDAVLRFHAARDEIAEQHLRLRTAIVEQSTLAKVLSLWFRSPPYNVPTRYLTPLQNVHEMAFLMLDEDLNLVSNGYRLISSVEELEQYLGFHGEFQRRRAATRARLDAIGSAAFVTDVAAGLIVARGLNPTEVLAGLRAARAEGDHGGMVIRTDTMRERLTLVEGIIDAAIDFKGGDYASGKLTLVGDYPKTLAMAAKGRALTAFVDHPAFAAVGVTIRMARALSGRLRLYHQIRLRSIEEVTALCGEQPHVVATTVATAPS